MINYKKYKHIEDIIEDYLQLQNERLEIPLMLEKTEEKLQKIRGSKTTGDNYNVDEAQDLFKIFSQQQKYLEQQQELNDELAEVEEIFKLFLSFISGTVEFERKEDHEKNKVTYQFWLEDDQIKSNR